MTGNSMKGIREGRGRREREQPENVYEDRHLCDAKVVGKEESRFDRFLLQIMASFFLSLHFL
jgi:hypothetical protein